MTREKAIDVLGQRETCRECVADCTCKECDEAFEMAIKSLEQEPCIQEKQANADKIDAVYIDGFKAGYSQARFDLEQEPCEDAISRQAVIERLKKEDKILYTTTGLNYLVRAIEEIPSVSTEKTGHWIYDRTRDLDGECKYECSECGMGSDVDYAYCMRCGAKMEVEE